MFFINYTRFYMAMLVGLYLKNALFHSRAMPFHLALGNTSPSPAPELFFI